ELGSRGRGVQWSVYLGKPCRMGWTTSRLLWRRSPRPHRCPSTADRRGFLSPDSRKRNIVCYRLIGLLRILRLIQTISLRRNHPYWSPRRVLSVYGVTGPDIGGHSQWAETVSCPASSLKAK